MTSNSATGQPTLFARVAARYADYLSKSISTEIGECDDMFVPDRMAHYLSVGRSAIDICAQAMILAQRDSFASVLDLPCGGGRVTRHLQAFLGDAKLYAADIDNAKQEFVVRTFGAQPVQVAADFSSRPNERFDLIFVGSLLTHFNSADFERALLWFIDALAPMGVLVVTTHGRLNADRLAKEPVARRGLKRFARYGFGFYRAQIVRANGISVEYGGNWSRPSWLLRLVEQHPEARILGFQECIWDHHHDVLILQKQRVI